MHMICLMGFWGIRTPEINLSVKIIGGKRTPTEVYVMSKSINKKVIQFQNGSEISNHEFETWIDSAIVRMIDIKAMDE